MHIFDTSGLALFSEVRTEFYRDCHGLLLVLDVTRRDSFGVANNIVNRPAGEWLEATETVSQYHAPSLNHKPLSATLMLLNCLRDSLGEWVREIRLELARYRTDPYLL